MPTGSSCMRRGGASDTGSLSRPPECMGRRLRFVPESSLVAVGWRVVQGRFLLRPSPELNKIVIGVLGRAQRMYPIRICGVAVLSNHLHLLLIAEDAKRVSEFMQYVGSKLAREVNRLTGWSGPVFHGRYSMIVVSEEEAAQVERLKYLLAQGCKENLVKRPADWPGVHCARALCEGENLVGEWFDRTQEHVARRRGGDRAPCRFASSETVALTPIPCWEHLSADAYRERIADLLADIEREAAAERALSGSRILGAEAVLTLHPHHLPASVASAPLPLVHAASEAVRRTFRDAYRTFVAAFRGASEALRSDSPTGAFPAGSFPPAPPFVPA
jgi:REP element-mobilizing transposase RayT